MSAKKTTTPKPDTASANLPVSPEEFQKMVYVYQLLQDQQNMLNEQMDMIQQQIMNATIAKTTMNGLKETKADDEVIIPMGTIAFTRAKLIDPQNVMIAVSKDIVIEKTMKDGIAFTERLMDNLTKIQQKIYAQLNEVSSKIHELEPQINSIYQQAGM